ncbi:unnamed protein product, partial [Discosporangium mesarthrocarpum]
MDTSLCLYSVPMFKAQQSKQLEPLPPMRVAHLAPVPRLLLVVHNTHLDLWRLPKPAQSFSGGISPNLEHGAQFAPNSPSAKPNP